MYVFQIRQNEKAYLVSTDTSSREPMSIEQRASRMIAMRLRSRPKKSAKNW